jgi:hypothetical protein
MCATCAYRPGTGANCEDGDPGLTAVREALLDARRPLFCHEVTEGPSQRLPCVGHELAIEARERQGWYVEHPPDRDGVVAALRVAILRRDYLFRAASDEACGAPPGKEERRMCVECGADTANARHGFVCYACRNRPLWDAEDEAGRG